MTNLRTKRRVLGAASVRGDQLISTEGEDLGLVHELLIDPEGGTIAYAVISLHGLPGFDSTLFVIPYQTLTPLPELHKFVFDLDKAHLIGELGSDPEGLPNLEGWKWVTNGQETFGVRWDCN